ncbi:MAG: hypothetical protein HZC41_12990 [Chloroflexi bacterium]|nr:hypothetical protein [Chloroflexota bacterium]
MANRMRWVGLVILALLAGVSIAAAQSLEPVPGKALLPGQPIRIQMTGDGPVDLVYYAAEPATISVYARSLDDSDSAVDTTLDVFGPDGTSLASNDDLNLDSGDAGIEDLSLLAAGAYRIRLGTFVANETGGVEVELVVGDAAPDTGDVIAGEIVNGQPFEHNFRGQAGEIVTITALATDPPSPNLDLALAVYSPDGTQLGYDDDSGPQAGLGDRDPALIELELPDDGEYRIEVSSYLNINGAFELRIEANG